MDDKVYFTVSTCMVKLCGLDMIDDEFLDIWWNFTIYIYIQVRTFPPIEIATCTGIICLKLLYENAIYSIDLQELLPELSLNKLNKLEEKIISKYWRGLPIIRY